MPGGSCNKVAPDLITLHHCHSRHSQPSYPSLPPRNGTGSAPSVSRGVFEHPLRSPLLVGGSLSDWIQAANDEGRGVESRGVDGT